MQAMSIEGFANTMECLYPVTLRLRQIGQNIGLDLIEIDETRRCSGVGTSFLF